MCEMWKEKRLYCDYPVLRRGSRAVRAFYSPVNLLPIDRNAASESTRLAVDERFVDERLARQVCESVSMNSWTSWVQKASSLSGLGIPMLVSGCSVPDVANGCLLTTHHETRLG